MPSPAGGRPRAAAATLLGLLLLAGCSIRGGESTEPPTGGASATAPGEPATRPTEVPSWLLECGGDDKGDRDESLRLTTLDLTRATWSMPAGFTETSLYSEDNPVEDLHSEWIAEPTDPPQPSLNVINVVIYTGVDWGDLTDGCGRVPLTAVESKLARYRDQIDAEPLGEAEMTTLAGLPAITQDIGLASYDYIGYWLFTETQLLHLYCQWTPDGDHAVIVRGCDDLAASLAVPGA